MDAFEVATWILMMAAVGSLVTMPAVERALGRV